MKPNIPNWSHYHIARSGKLYSNHSGKWLEVKPCIKSDGYIHNYLYDDEGNKKKFYRHRLVAMVYLENPQNLAQVCHKDNDPSNNRVENLYWGTSFDNMGQCVKDGRFYFIGSKRRQRTYARIDVEAIAKAYTQGIPRKDILNEWNISTGVLYDILRTKQIPLRVPRKSKK
nr:MAG TPA: homing endonuclease [Caudoviricetes sp.]